MKDFTLTAYRQLLLALRQAGYNFYTFEDWCDGKAQGRYVILRHDVDKNPQNALEFAKLESELSIQSTYFFQTSKKIFKPQIIRQIVSFGHEIGYHYRDLVDAVGNSDKAIDMFRLNLTKLRSIVEIRTICMHGSPASKWDNKDLWKTYNYHDFGIVGEPYFDFLSPLSPGRGAGGEVNMLYFTDTARMWDGDKYNVRDKTAQSGRSGLRIHSTFDFIQWLETTPANNVLMITTHPQRWANSSLQWVKELLMQTLKNYVKRWIVCRS